MASSEHNPLNGVWVGPMPSAYDMLPETTTSLRPPEFYSDSYIDFSNGATKQAVGKPMVNLVPMEMVFGAARAFEFGLTKYEVNNWRKGLPSSMLYSATMRHLLKHASGEVTDPESGLVHLDHAAASLAMLMCNLGEDDLLASLKQEVHAVDGSG